MAVPARSRLTYDDYVAIPDDGQRWEIIDGEAYVTPAPRLSHQDVVGRVFLAIANHLAEHGGGRVFVSPVDVVLSEHDVVQPDVVFVADSDAHKLTDANIQGAPTLAAEVLSDPRHDLVRKRDLYARSRVREYWVVFPEAERVEVYRLAEGDAYPPPTLFVAGMTLTTDLLPGLAIDIARLFS